MAAADQKIGSINNQQRHTIFHQSQKMMMDQVTGAEQTTLRDENANNTNDNDDGNGACDHVEKISKINN